MIGTELILGISGIGVSAVVLASELPIPAQLGVAAALIPAIAWFVRRETKARDDLQAKLEDLYMNDHAATLEALAVSAGAIRDSQKLTTEQVESLSESIAALREVVRDLRGFWRVARD